MYVYTLCVLMLDNEKQLEQDINNNLWKNIQEITSFFDKRKNLYTAFSTLQDIQQLLSLYKDFLKQWVKVQLLLNWFREQDKKKYSTRIKNILHGFADKETLGTSWFNGLYMQWEIVEKYTQDTQEIFIHDILEHGDSEQLGTINHFIDENCDIWKDNFLMRRFNDYANWIKREPYTKKWLPSHPHTSWYKSFFMWIFPFKKQYKKETPQEDPYGFLGETDELMKQLIELLKWHMISKDNDYNKDKKWANDSISSEEISEGNTEEKEAKNETEPEKKSNFEKVKKILSEKILHRNKETNDAIKDTFESFSKDEMGKLENVIFKWELRSFFKHPNEKKIKNIIKTYSGLNSPKDKLLKWLRYLVSKYKVWLGSLALLATVLTASPKLRQLGEDKINALWYWFSPTELSMKENPWKLTGFVDDDQALGWMDGYKQRSDSTKEYQKSIDAQIFLHKTKEKNIISLEWLKAQWESSTDKLFQELRKVEDGYMYNNWFVVETITPEDSIRLRDIIDTINFGAVGDVLNYWTDNNSISNRPEVEDLAKTISDGIQFFPLNDENVLWVSIDYSEENRKILMNTKIALEEAQHVLIHELWHKVSKESDYMFVTEWGNEYKVIRDSWNIMGKDYFGKSYTDAVIDYLLLSHYYDTEEWQDKSSLKEKQYNEFGWIRYVSFNSSQSMDDLFAKYQWYIQKWDTQKVKDYTNIIKYRKLTEILDANKNNEIDPLLIMYFLDKDFPSDSLQQQQENFSTSSDIELWQNTVPWFQKKFGNWWLKEDDFSPNGWQYLSGLREKYQQSDFAKIEKLPLEQQIKKIDEMFPKFIGKDIKPKNSINTPRTPMDGFFSRLRENLFKEKQPGDTYLKDDNALLTSIVSISIMLFFLFMLIGNKIYLRQNQKKYKNTDIHNFLYQNIQRQSLRIAQDERSAFFGLTMILNSISMYTNMAWRTTTASIFLGPLFSLLLFQISLSTSRQLSKYIGKKNMKKKMKKNKSIDPIQKNIALLEYNKKYIRKQEFSSINNMALYPNTLHLLPITKQKLKNIDEVFSKKSTKQKNEKPQKMKKVLKEGTDSNLLVINTEDHQGQRINRYKTAGLAPGKICIINETKKMELKNEVANNGQILVWVNLDFEDTYDDGIEKKDIKKNILQDLNTIYNFLAQIKIYAHTYNKNIDIMMFRNNKLIDMINLYWWSSNTKVDIKKTIWFYHKTILHNYVNVIKNTKLDYLNKEIMEKYLKDKKYDKIIPFGLHTFPLIATSIIDPEDKRNIDISPTLNMNDMALLTKGEKISTNDKDS